MRVNRYIHEYTIANFLMCVSLCIYAFARVCVNLLCSFEQTALHVSHAVKSEDEQGMDSWETYRGEKGGGGEGEGAHGIPCC